MTKFLFILIGLTLCFGYTTPTATNTLTIQVTGYKSQKGQIGLALYNNENQFTDNPWKHFIQAKSSGSSDTVTIVVKDLPKGDYAISFLDDENSNEKMDFTFWGYPEEGYGFSNNVKPSLLGPPKYKDCTFTVNKNTVVNLNVQYW